MKPWQSHILDSLNYLSEKKLMFRPRCPGKLIRKVKVNSTDKLQGTNPTVIIYDEWNDKAFDEIIKIKPILKGNCNE